MERQIKSSLDAEEIGKRIRRAREIRGMSREELAERSGVDRNRLSTYENGARKPKMDQLIKFAEVLNIDPALFDAPDTTTVKGAMLTFFELEERYDVLFHERGEEIVYLQFAPHNKDITRYIKEWSNKKREYLQAENAAITEEDKKRAKNEYDTWRMEFPTYVDQYEEGYLKIKQENYLKSKIIEYSKKLVEVRLKDAIDEEKEKEELIKEILEQIENDHQNIELVEKVVKEVFRSKG